MNKVDIGVACGQNSDFYVNFLLDNMRRTMSVTDARIILCINNYKEFDLEVIKQWQGEIEYHYLNTDTVPGSEGHGLALNFLLSKMTAKHGMFVDCDIGFLAKGWDSWMLQQLDQGKIEVVGTEYTNSSKYRGFPNTIVCAFHTEFLQSSGIDFRPLLEPRTSEYIVQTDAEAHAWGTPIGHRILLDCGYQLPLKVRNAGCDGKPIKFVGTGVLGCGQEHHVDGKPFLTHLKGSSVKDKNDPGAKLWMQKIEQFLTKNGI
jgi:hypothetical protein